MPDVFQISEKQFGNAEVSTWTSIYINGLAQDCSNSIANALELLQSDILIL